MSTLVRRVCANGCPFRRGKRLFQLFPAAHRFELVHVDLFGGGSSWTKPTRGSRYILVIVDHFSRYRVAVPIQTQTADSAAEAFFQNCIMRFGCPMRVQTDQGANFESSLFAELCQRCHIAKRRTLAYYRQCNGACERLNRTLLHLLETSVYDCPADWYLFLPEVCFAYHTTPHRHHIEQRNVRLTRYCLAAEKLVYRVTSSSERLPRLNRSTCM
jgi:transposase InsO family protein